MDDSLCSKRVLFSRNQTPPITLSINNFSTGQMDTSSQVPVQQPVPVLGMLPPSPSTVIGEPLVSTGLSVNSHDMQFQNEQNSTGMSVDGRTKQQGVFDSSNSALPPELKPPEVARRLAFSSTLEPRTLRGKVEVQTNKSKQLTEYGAGAWSVVYQAVYNEKSPLSVTRVEHGLPSPPESPIYRKFGEPQIVAVKAPQKSHLEDAKAVILKEAQILTYIQPYPSADPFRTSWEHIVTFLGFDPGDNAIVMEALPLTLSAFSQKRGKAAKENFSTRTMYEPVVGTKQWIFFANQLIAGLEFLKDLNIVHGDIKPTNILLRARTASKCDIFAEGTKVFDPVYCDFSSAHVVQDDIEPEPVSAVTTAYAAPELLEAFRHPSGGEKEPIRPLPTYSSDVFALGATLLVPAVGSDVYGEASSSMQILAMAMHGQPLEGARRGQQATRVMRDYLVDRVIRRAVVKKPDERLDVHAWKAIAVEELKALKGESAQ